MFLPHFVCWFVCLLTYQQLLRNADVSFLNDCRSWDKKQSTKFGVNGGARSFAVPGPTSLEQLT